MSRIMFRVCQIITPNIYVCVCIIHWYHDHTNIHQIKSKSETKNIIIIMKNAIALQKMTLLLRLWIWGVLIIICIWIYGMFSTSFFHPYVSLEFSFKFFFFHCVIRRFLWWRLFFFLLSGFASCLMIKRLLEDKKIYESQLFVKSVYSFPTLLQKSLQFSYH